MKLPIGTLVYNTDNCTVHRHSLKVTEDRPHPRVLYRKEEVLCNQRQNASHYFNWVKVYKYIDGNPVKSYEWLQTVDPDELQEFLTIEQSIPETPPTEEEEKRRYYKRKYYLEHRQELIDKRKEYYKKNGK